MRIGSYCRMVDAEASYSMYWENVGEGGSRDPLHQACCLAPLARLTSSLVRRGSVMLYRRSRAVRSLVEIPTAPVSMRITLDRDQYISVATDSCVSPAY